MQFGTTFSLFWQLEQPLTDEARERSTIVGEFLLNVKILLLKLIELLICSICARHCLGSLGS